MAVIKEESEDLRIEETFRLKQEDTEEQTGWFSFSKLNRDNFEKYNRSVLIKMLFLCGAGYKSIYIYLFILPRHTMKCKCIKRGMKNRP